MSTPISKIFNRFRNDYLQHNSATINQHKVMNSIMACKTEKLGFNIEKCDSCGHTHIHYNSCNNRHCPNCQGMKKHKWILEKQNDILPVKYMHVVFTIPGELRTLFLYNKRLLYNNLFNSAWKTIETFSKDKRNRLEADMGMISILHTWKQNIEYHPHLHCIIPAGGITINNKWKSTPTNGDYLFNTDAMGQTFKGVFMKKLKDLYKNKELKYWDLKQTPGQFFYGLKEELYGKSWLVYAKKSFRNSTSVFEYLGRYTHKIAISNYRIKNVTDKDVTFEYLDRTDGYKKKLRTVTGEKFIKLFLLHVLPPRFVKIRNYGFLSSRKKTKKLTALMEYFYKPKYKKSESKSVAELIEIIYGIEIGLCPICKQGMMKTIKTKPRPRAA
jgi:hypothetical protein